MRNFFLAVIVIATTACSSQSSQPTNFTARHCISNIECKSDESCLSWREVIPSSPNRGHWYRDGYCLRDE